MIEKFETVSEIDLNNTFIKNVLNRVERNKHLWKFNLNPQIDYNELHH